MLIIMPIPVLIKWKRSWKEKIQLYALFTCGIFIVAVTVVRLPQNWNNSTAQVNRTTWASAELLASTIVANAPTLYSLNKRRKASPSASHPSASEKKYPTSNYPGTSSGASQPPRFQDDQFELMSYGADGKAENVEVIGQAVPMDKEHAAA